MNTTKGTSTYLPQELIDQAREHRATSRAIRLAQLQPVGSDVPQSSSTSKVPDSGGIWEMWDLPPIPKSVPETLSPMSQDGTESAQYQLARLLSDLDSLNFFGFHKVIRRGCFYLLGQEFFVPELSVQPVQCIYCVCNELTMQMFIYNEQLKFIRTINY